MPKKILIFGASGQLGSDCLKIFKNSYAVVGYTHAQADITDSASIKAIFEKENPDIIINATAYNKVEQAEVEPESAFNINANGVKVLADFCAHAGAVLVHVSSDYVFDGNKEFFTEQDTPNPLNAYGRSKLGGEEAVRQALSNYYLIRTSSVFGAKEGKQKKNFVDRMISLAKEGQTLKVVNDQVMSPTYSYDLAAKIKELIEKSAPFGLYHITNQGSCSWYEFTLKILEFMGLDAKVEPITSSISGSKVNRPKKSILKNSALEKAGISPMPNWEDALKRYLKEKYD